MTIIATSNDGPRIVSSTYWGSPHERAGKIHCSCNAGAIRVLLPRSMAHLVDEMSTARHIVVSRGPWPEEAKEDAVELLFDDGSESPFALHLGAESWALLPGDPGAGSWSLSIWTADQIGEPLLLASWESCWWRQVARIPCLEPWPA